MPAPPPPRLPPPTAVRPNNAGRTLPPRLSAENDVAAKYVRRKGDRWQARPYHRGWRYNLGWFPSRREATQAVDDFLHSARSRRLILRRHIRQAELAPGLVVYWGEYVGEHRGQPLRVWTRPYSCPHAARDRLRRNLAEHVGFASARQIVYGRGS